MGDPDLVEVLVERLEPLKIVAVIDRAIRDVFQDFIDYVVGFTLKREIYPELVHQLRHYRELPDPGAPHREFGPGSHSGAVDPPDQLLELDSYPCLGCVLE